MTQIITEFNHKNNLCQSVYSVVKNNIINEVSQIPACSQSKPAHFPTAWHCSRMHGIHLQNGVP